MDFNISGEILYNNALATKGRNLYLNVIKAAAIANIVRVNGAAHSINGFKIKGNSTDAAAMAALIFEWYEGVVSSALGTAPNIRGLMTSELILI
ncbi:hypothetical protein JJQ40_25365, partial [Enterobacter hormaechei]|nr:hypothetical protein [Enterobacter hormaechei]